jgi:hypothetical protein
MMISNHEFTNSRDACPLAAAGEALVACCHDIQTQLRVARNAASDLYADRLQSHRNNRNFQSQKVFTAAQRRQARFGSVVRVCAQR